MIVNYDRNDFKDEDALRSKGVSILDYRDVISVLNAATSFNTLQGLQILEYYEISQNSDQIVFSVRLDDRFRLILHFLLSPSVEPTVHVHSLELEISKA